MVSTLALALASCGGEDETSQPAGNDARGFSLTEEQQACLKEEGVTLPQSGEGQRPPDGGTGSPPPGGGEPPQGNGQPPQGAEGQRPQLSEKERKRLQERQQKMTAAFEKCGIDMPQFGPGGAGGAPNPEGGQDQAPDPSRQ